MKLLPVLMASLIIASAFCGPSKLYGTVNDAFSANLGKGNAFLTLGSFDSDRVSSAEIIFDCSLATLQSRLEAEGLHPVLAAYIRQRTNLPHAGDFNLRFIKPVPFSPVSNTVQMAACVYRLVGDDQLHFICLASHADLSLKTSEKLAITEMMHASIAALFETNRLRYSRLHAFNDLGFESLHQLGNDDLPEQKELDDFFDAASREKKSIVATIYEKKDDPFVVKLYKNGIKSFSSKAKIDLVEGVKEDRLKDYTERLIKKLGIQNKDKEKFRAEIEMASLGSKGEWKEIDFIYKKSKGQILYLMLLTVLDTKRNAFDFLIADITASFAMGDDIFVYTETKKILFGLFKKTKIKVERKPASLSEEGVKYFFMFFKAASIDSFSKFRSGTRKARKTKQK